MIMRLERREELQELRDEMAETQAMLDKLLESSDDQDDAKKKAPVNGPSRAIDYQLGPKRNVAFKSCDAVGHDVQGREDFRFRLRRSLGPQGSD